MAKPTISTVMPAFNSERFLAAAIESILAQTLRPDEIILVDDGSTDGTKQVIAAFGEAITYLYQENRGPAASRNLGIRAAKGDFIAFLDADDVWLPAKLESQLQVFIDDPELDYCLCSIRAFWEEEVASEAQQFKEHPRVLPMVGYATGPMLARRDVFERVGLLDERLWSTDAADWFIRADAAGLKKKVLPEVLMLRRFHSANMTRRMDAPFRVEWLAMMKRKLDAERAVEDA